MKKPIDKLLKKPIGVLKGDMEHEEGGDNTIKMTREEIKEKKFLLVLEKGKIFSFKDEEIDIYIDSLPEDYNVFYVIENDDTIFINKDYKEIAPMVRYLLGNVYKSLEMRTTKTNRYINIGFFIFWLIFFVFMLFFINKGTYEKLDILNDNIANTCTFLEPSNDVYDKNDGNVLESIENNENGGIIDINDLDSIEINKGAGNY